MAPSTVDLLQARLALLQPLTLSIADESHRHVGHAGAQGGGHYRVDIVAEVFSGKPTLVRHRLVYDAAGDLMRGKIHALSIHARAPDEV